MPLVGRMHRAVLDALFQEPHRVDGLVHPGKRGLDVFRPGEVLKLLQRLLRGAGLRLCVGVAVFRVIPLLLRCGVHLVEAFHAVEVFLRVLKRVIGLVEGVLCLGKVLSPRAVCQQVQLRFCKVHAASGLAKLDLQGGVIYHGQDVPFFHEHSLAGIQVEDLSR